MNENLWLSALRAYWSDPKNVIGPPGALVRRIVKLMWLALSFYVLFWIAGPSQVASWRLWMEDDKLASDIGWGFTYAAALGFAVVGYAAEQSKSIRVPLPVPERFWPLNRWRWVHLHLPNVRVTIGSVLVSALFVIALLGQWNFYLHDNLSTGGASVAAIEGSTSRVTEAQAALNHHDAETSAALAGVDQAIRETSAGSPTGRSRLVAQRASMAASAAATRAQLAQDLREARGETVTVRATSTDPRPVDAQVASALGADRSLISSLLDLLRSGVVELLLMMGMGLGLMGAVSEIGVPRQRVEPEPEQEAEQTVEETAAAPEVEPEPPPRRYVLPAATEQDMAEAVIMGPHGAPEPVENEAQPEAPAPADEPAEATEATTDEPSVEELDPLAAEHLKKEAA